MELFHLIIDGYFKKRKINKIKYIFIISEIILDNSNKFIKIINNEIIKKLINKYLFVK